MKKVLFISGSMGLGHAIRDIAIARQMLVLDNQIRITWLANGAAAKEIQSNDEMLHPKWVEYGDLNSAAQRAAKGFSLNLDDWQRDGKIAFIKNIKVFSKIVANENYDLIVGDETYAIWFNLQDVQFLKPTHFVMIYDFMPRDYITLRTRLKKVFSGTKLYGHSADIKRLNNPLNHILFIGDILDIPNNKFGFLLPNKRNFAEKHFTFVGHVLPFDPNTNYSRAEMKKKLGYKDCPLITCTVGGAGVGRKLLDLCFKSYDKLQEEIPNLQMVLVYGPLLDKNIIKGTDHITVKEYVPDLYQHFAASDLVITHGGGSTTIELTALRVPFLYFPLEDHFEQQIHVSERIERHRAGKKMIFSETDSALLVEAAVSEMNKPIEYEDINANGAQKAAAYLCSLL